MDFQQTNIANSGGVIIPVLFSLKATTLGFAAFPFLFILIYNKHLRLWPVLLGIILFSGFGLLLYLFVLQPDLNDLLNATLFQASPGLNNLLSYEKFFNYMLHLLAYNPFIFFAFIVGSLFLFFNFRDKTLILILSCFYLIVMSTVNIQGKYFHYHYLNLLPFSVATFYWLIKHKAFRTYRILLGVSLLLIMTSYTKFYFQKIHTYPKWATPASSTHNYLYNFSERKTIADNIQTFLPSDTTTVYYLTEGGINFYLPNPSYTRYFYPLPLQRSYKNAKLQKSEIYQLEKQKLLSYQGEYIIHQPNWFYKDRFPKIKFFLDSNFEVVYSFKGYNKMKLLKRI